LGWACSAFGGGERLYRILVGNLRERDHLRDPIIDERIILRWIFRNWCVKA